MATPLIVIKCRAFIDLLLAINGTFINNKGLHIRPTNMLFVNVPAFINGPYKYATAV